MNKRRYDLVLEIFRGKLDILFRMELRKKYVWNVRSFVGDFLILLCFVIKVSGKLLQFDLSKLIKGLEYFIMKVQVIFLDKDLRIVEMLFEDKMEYVEDDSQKYKLK